MGMIGRTCDNDEGKHMDMISATGMSSRRSGSMEKGTTMATNNLGLGFQQDGMVITGMDRVEERWCTTTGNHHERSMYNDN